VTGYTETFRGDVHPWEVDATEHFTVAYYFEKFEAATWRFLRQNGVDPAVAQPVEALAHYKSELRDRDIFRIESALIESGDTPLIAHKLFNAETGALCTTLRQRFTGISLTGATVAWDGDAAEDRPIPGDGPGWMMTARDVGRPSEANWAGNLSLSAMVHRYSTANGFIMAAFGLTPEYMTKNRIGLSTFEMAFTFNGALRPGDLFDVESCIATLGGSSVRLCHRLRNAEGGEILANLSQFGVQLDLDARRPARIADDLREKAQRLLA